MMGRRTTFVQASLDEMRWESVGIEFLIDIIRDYKLIWFSGDAMFNDKSAKDKAWATISTAVHKPVDKCKAKWKNLVDVYRSLRKKFPLGTAAQNRVKWAHFDSMVFFDEQLKIVKRRRSLVTRSGETSATATAIVLDADDADFGDCKGFGISTSPTSSDVLDQSEIAQVRRLGEDDLYAYSNDEASSVIKVFESAVNKRQRNEYEIFGEYVGAALSNIPDDLVGGLMQEIQRSIERTKDIARKKFKS